MKKATLHVDNYIEMITIIHIYIFFFLLSSKVLKKLSHSDIDIIINTPERFFSNKFMAIFTPMQYNNSTLHTHAGMYIQYPSKMYKHKYNIHFNIHKKLTFVYVNSSFISIIRFCCYFMKLYFDQS